MARYGKYTLDLLDNNHQVVVEPTEDEIEKMNEALLRKFNREISPWEKKVRLCEESLGL